jgi:HD-like signal output (HDOD) protein/CheY-like chemotaxis protein
MKRILFVDDETRILDGIRRMLFRHRGDWDLQFAADGETAVALIEREPVDIVISDMRMPGMDGAEVLEAVRRVRPGAVRIILSGYSEQDASVRAARVAHQFLSKPCEREGLEETIHRALAMRKLLDNSTVQDLIGGVTVLPSAPYLYHQLSECITRDGALGEVVEIVQQDISMCARMLQIVNSAFFGLPQYTSSIESAVAYLGLNVIQSLALTAGLFKSYEGKEGLNALSLDREQRHAAQVGAAARAVMRDKWTKDHAFMAGMVHDIGKVVLAAQQPDRYAALLARPEAGSITPLWEAERIHFGATHADVGAYLLGIWGLPQEVVAAVAYHHRPGEAAFGDADIIAAVALANAVAKENEDGDAGTDGHIRRIIGDKQVDAWREEMLHALQEDET